MSGTVEMAKLPLVIPDVVGKLTRDGIVSLPVDFRDRSVPLLDYFKGMIETLSDEAKAQLEVDMDAVQMYYDRKGIENPYVGANGNRTDFGLYFRDDLHADGTEGDRKWVFHIRPYDDVIVLLDIYREREVELPVGFESWYLSLTQLLDDILDYVTSVLGEVDRVYGTMLAWNLRHEKSMRQHVFRFLYYLPKECGEYADCHCDFSAFTGQLAESHPGLQYRLNSDESDVWQDYHNRIGWTVFFAGRKMTTATGGLIPGVAHRVMKLSVECGGPRNDEPRLSLIIFLHMPFALGPSCPS